DNEFYKIFEKKNPHIWKNSTKIINTMLECFIAEDSKIKDGVKYLLLSLKHFMIDILKPNILIAIIIH
ncbi:TPA: hypothetical protein ACOIAU_002968, partial [Clostridioides difficile]